jgi:hypothetical protein
MESGLLRAEGLGAVSIEGVPLLLVDLDTAHPNAQGWGVSVIESGEFPVILSIGFGYWTFVFIQADRLWWAVLTAVFAASGMLGLVDELRGRDEDEDSTTGASATSAPEELGQVGSSTGGASSLRNSRPAREGGAGSPVAAVSLPGRRAAAGRPQGRP